MQILVDTFNWFKKARPEPTNKDLHSQLGVHFEEVHEMLQEINPLTSDAEIYLGNAKMYMHELANFLKKSDNAIEIPTDRRVAFLDSLCDQIVTATGSAYVTGVDIVAGLEEVNRSNYSKFDEDGNPIFDDNKKVIKGPNYSPADLTPFV